MRTPHAQKLLTAALALAFLSAACQPGATNTNATNLNAPNSNSTNAAGALNANDSSAAANAFETREPSQYQATLVITQAATDKGQAIQTPNIQIARSGDNRRYSISGLPAIGDVVFLDRADKRYLLLPTKKQYVELGPETTGFDVRSLTPAQMADRMKSQPGVERVGDDTVNGRSVVKYRYAAAGHTTTQAGDVRAENFIYVDKDTGLPIKVETYGQSTGNVAGASRAKVVAELRDLTTTVDAATFDLPQGYAQITKEQIQQYVSIAASAFKFLLSNMGQQGAAPSNPPTLVTPAGTASPSPTR
ncbi:MAG: hypothetical protein LC785_13950 [Acidobacteria bacterium]|nr:hypothetical protein [Acidobacteriota bacterium]MCA1643016.1 hypothetical protein [Acidobacteriota bacterium]